MAANTTGANLIHAIGHIKLSADTLRQMKKVVRNRKKSVLKHPKL